MSELAVRVRGLEKRFGPHVALRGIDLDVAAGSTLAVVGPNGAGKTTLLRICAGLVRPSAGLVALGAAGDEPRRARGRVGYIGHATFLYPALTARENLRFAARLYGVPDPASRVATLLADYDLEAAADRPAGDFSRGMAQRLAIARGLVHEPDLLLLDEPFTGLDPPAADRLAERLARLREGNRALLLVTHDLARAAALADRAVILAGGSVAHREERPTDGAALEAAYRHAVRAGGARPAPQASAP